MIIDDLPTPTPTICSTCNEPLTWIWVHHLKRNVAVIPLRDVDRFSFRLHTCAVAPDRTWRYLQKVPPATARRGAKRARAALAAAAKIRDSKEKTDGPS